MKFKNGDRIRVINAGFGARAVDGQVGIVTSEKSFSGLTKNEKGNFNIKVGNVIWKVSGTGDYELIEQTSPITINEPMPFSYTHFYENLSYTRSTIVRSQSDAIIDIQNLTHPANKYKVIYNGLTTVAVLGDGTRGIAKCSESDEYDKQKGADIALVRARISQLEKELKNLTM